MSRNKQKAPSFESGYPKKQPKPAYTIGQVGFKTKKQHEYYNSVMENVITFSTGPAGTGKSAAAKIFLVTVLLAMAKGMT